MAKAAAPQTGAGPRASRSPGAGVGPAADFGLHFEVLYPIEGAGLLAAGWLGDPGDRIRGIAVDAGAGTPFDLLRETAVSSSWQVFEAFGVQPRQRPRLALIGLVPVPAAFRVGRMTLAFALDGGAAVGGVVDLAGGPDALGRILAAVPLDFALAAAARIVAVRRGAGGLGPMPPRLDDLLQLIHRRIAAPEGGEASAVLRVANAGMLISGRVPPGGDAAGALTAVSLAGRRIALTPAAGEAGRFAAFAAAASLPEDERHWFIETAAEDGLPHRTPFLCPPPTLPARGIEAVLNLVDPGAGNLERLLRDAVSPAVDALWAEARHVRPQPTEIVCGEPPAAPLASIIVPLHRRTDFLRHQIARFSNDPELRSAAALGELIYVLDDTAPEADFERYCRQIHDIYRVPFRALLLHGNRGYSAANNAGVAAAAGEFVLLLNSDVLPLRSRWLSQLARAYRSLERCAVLGCRLLFEDGSLQHAGMSFRRSTVLSEAWENEHPAKGLPAGFDPHRGPARVPAVTGACLLIDRALYRELGGLSEDYVLGDFEDSDLCLRAQREGWNVWYTPAVELYHLERQSVRLIGEAGWRHALTLHNMLKHSDRWGGLIPAVLDRVGGVSAASAP